MNMKTNTSFVSTGIECPWLPRAGARLQRLVQMEIYESSFKQVFHLYASFPSH